MKENLLYLNFNFLSVIIKYVIICLVIVNSLIISLNVDFKINYVLVIYCINSSRMILFSINQEQG